MIRFIKFGKLKFKKIFVLQKCINFNFNGYGKYPNYFNDNKVGEKIVGDVNFDELKSKTKAITPVPGGVGPMTIACLLKNTLECFKAHQLQSYQFLSIDYF